MIHFTYKYLKPLAILLSLATFFQCCAIYDKRSVYVDEAISKTQVKIIATSGEKTVFEDIYLRSDGKLFGYPKKKQLDTINRAIPVAHIEDYKAIYNTNGIIYNVLTKDSTKYIFNGCYYLNDTLYGQQTVKQKKEILIPRESISRIYVYNQKKSTTGTVFLVIGSVATGILISAIIATAVSISKDGLGWWGDGI